MRIAQLDLERYGLFEDRRLVFDPDAALHVVFGRNEAGKTSALSAIGDLLFGFGARTDYDFRHEAKTLRIGGQFHHSDGRVIAVRRRKGNKRTLVDDDDRPLPDETLAPLLGGVSREVFSREFGLTAQALRDGGHALLGAGGRLAETLAATSAGMSALSRRQARLQQEADELFTPRRSAGKPFYVAMERRETADRSLREAIVTRDAIRQATAAARPGYRRGLVWLVTSAPVLWLVGALMPWLAPFDLETYFRYHFTKVGDQTRLMLATYRERAAARGSDHDALDRLLAALGPASA